MKIGEEFVFEGRTVVVEDKAGNMVRIWDCVKHVYRWVKA